MSGGPPGAAVGRGLVLLLAGAVAAGCGIAGSPSPAGATSPSPIAPAASSPAAAPSAASSAAPSAASSTAPSPAVSPTADGGLEARLVAIDDAVSRWLAATEPAAGHLAAEEARNLVVGPAGPGYGDVDGDGAIRGASGIGLLPGTSGEPGLATEAAGPCVERDVLGGSWADPAERWAILARAIADWTRSNNTFPALPSHPQRVVGWSTLALASGDLATILEYGGHARIHSAVSLRAVTGCAG